MRSLHINLCSNCDHGDYLFGERIDAYTRGTLSAMLGRDELNREDFTYLCKECMKKENSAYRSWCDCVDPDPAKEPCNGTYDVACYTCGEGLPCLGCNDCKKVMPL